MDMALEMCLIFLYEKIVIELPGQPLNSALMHILLAGDREL